MARRANTKQAEIARVLRQRIADGTLSPGDPLPSEAELNAEFGSNNTTVRGALAILEDEGLVKARQGVGVYVRAPEAVCVLAMNSHVPELCEPLVPYALNLDPGAARRRGFSRTEPASAWTAGLIGVVIGDLVAVRGFTEFTDGRPLLTSTSYLPAKLADDPRVNEPDATELRIGQLALSGLTVRSDGKPRQASRPPMAAEAILLGLTKGVAVTVITHRLLVDVGSGRPVRAAVQVVGRGDRLELEFP
jgi:GntR family transcriptional regulator